MKLLAIDTSTDRASVAISLGNELYAEEQDGLRQHAQLLLPMVERLLAHAGLSFSQLDAIVFGRGPGSFTGLRIACSVAKGLAYAYDLPLYPVSSLAAIADEVYQTLINPCGQPLERSAAQRRVSLAPQIWGEGKKEDVFGADVVDTPILAMIDARMHQVYWGCFMRKSCNVMEKVSSASDILLPFACPFILAGVGLEPYALQLPEAIQAKIVRQCNVFPSANAMIRLVQSGQVKAVNAAEALPVYIRDQVTQGGVSRG